LYSTLPVDPTPVCNKSTSSALVRHTRYYNTTRLNCTAHYNWTHRIFLHTPNTTQLYNTLQLDTTHCSRHATKFNTLQLDTTHFYNTQDTLRLYNTLQLDTSHFSKLNTPHFSRHTTQLICTIHCN